MSNCISDFPYIHGNLLGLQWLQITPFRKEWGSVQMAQSLCTSTVRSSAVLLFVVIFLHTLYGLPSCSSSELHHARLLTHSFQTRVSENICEVVSSQHFFSPLPKRSGEVLQKIWMSILHTALYSTQQ